MQRYPRNTGFIGVSITDFCRELAKLDDEERKDLARIEAVKVPVRVMLLKQHLIKKKYFTQQVA